MSVEFENVEVFSAVWRQ